MSVRFATRAAMPKLATEAKLSSERILPCVFTDSLCRCGLFTCDPRPATNASTLASLNSTREMSGLL